MASFLERMRLSAEVIDFVYNQDKAPGSVPKLFQEGNLQTRVSYNMFLNSIDISTRQFKGKAVYKIASISINPDTTSRPAAYKILAELLDRNFPHDDGQGITVSPESDHEKKTVTCYILTPEVELTIEFNVPNENMIRLVEEELIKHISSTDDITRIMSRLTPTIRDRLSVWSKKYASSLNILAEFLPGMKNIEKHPIEEEEKKFPNQWTISNIVQNLNDSHEWDRDQIADWIETLDEVPYFEAKADSDVEELPKITVLDEVKRFLPCVTEQGLF